MADKTDLQVKWAEATNISRAWLRLFFILGGIISAWVMIAAGSTMTNINSQAGNTITEAFYHAMGTGFIGLGIFAGCMLIAIGVFLGRKDKVPEITPKPIS